MIDVQSERCLIALTLIMTVFNTSLPAPVLISLVICPITGVPARKSLCPTTISATVLEVERQWRCQMGARRTPSCPRAMGVYRSSTMMATSHDDQLGEIYPTMSLTVHLALVFHVFMVMVCGRHSI